MKSANANDPTSM